MRSRVAVSFLRNDDLLPQQDAQPTELFSGGLKRERRLLGTREWGTPGLMHSGGGGLGYATGQRGSTDFTVGVQLSSTKA